MSASENFDEGAIRRRSLLSAALTVVGATAIAASLWYSTTLVVDARAEQQTLRHQNQQLGDQLTQLRASIVQEKRTLSQAKCALDNSRLAINAVHARRYDEAIALYDEALTCDPTNAYILNLTAYSHFKAGKTAEAIRLQKASLQADPTYAWGYFDLARFDCASGPSNREDAARAVTRAIALRPDLKVTMRGDGEFTRVCRGIIDIPQ